jgi:hypothetical protein
MKIKIVLLVLIMTMSLKAQSIVTLGTGTSIEVLAGADFCADSIGGSGTISGAGTICGNPVTAVEQIVSTELPSRFDISQNYPNPFNPSTMIKFQLPKASFVIVKIYDAIGREVGKLSDEEHSAGYYTLIFDGSSLAAGVYFYRIEARDISGESAPFIKTLKMALIK